ncbi:hypothetical protein D3C81_2304130 [compost metagenome]
MRLRNACGQEIAIGFVQDKPEAAPGAELGEGGDRLGGIDRAGRVVGRDQHDGAGARVD